MDVEHVVILMQENRSFDHYFGTLRGVRGFADPRPVTLPGGRSVWAQRGADRDGGRTIWPFRLDYNNSNARCFTGLDHSWKDSQARWRNWDVWAEQKGPLTMAHLTRADIPYYHALADQFTICDGYHCSLQGPTGPNRLYHFSGTNGLWAGFSGVFYERIPSPQFWLLHAAVAAAGALLILVAAPPLSRAARRRQAITTSA